MSVAHLRVASVPVDSLRGDAPRNVERIAHALAEAAREGIGLVVFPENCIAGYASMTTLHRDELEALAEPLHGASLSAVADAVERTGVAAGVGLIERAAHGCLFNSYVVCMPGRLRHCHRKLHAFEHRSIASGDRFTVFDTPWGIRMGILIGGDSYLIENVRMTALMGATLLIAPHRSYGERGGANRPMQPVSMAQWLHSDGAATDRAQGADWSRNWLPARAADNGMFVVFSDGSEASHSRKAMIVDPSGRILAEHADARVSAEVDPHLIATSAGRQWLTARRADLYGPLGDPVHRSPMTYDSRGMESGGSIAVGFAQVRRNRF
jgi:predicted amidohydrolase